MKVRKMRKPKQVEMCEVTISIPKNVLIQAVEDRRIPLHEKTHSQRYIDHLVGKAIMTQYYKLMTGGDTNDSRERDTSN